MTVSRGIATFIRLCPQFGRGCLSDAFGVRFGRLPFSLRTVSYRIVSKSCNFARGVFKSEPIFADTPSARKINYRACERKRGLILGCLTRNRDFCSFVPPVWSWMDSAIDVGDSFCDRNCDSFCDRNCDSFCDSNLRPSQHYDRIHITS